MSTTPAVQYIFYHYDPSMAAAVVFIVLFVISSVAHMVQLLKTRTWYFIPFIIGGLFEVIGYVGRALSAKETPDWTVGPYVMQSLLLLLAPALFAASIYMILGRIIVLTDGESQSLIRARWLTKVFVCGDVISFLAQSAGGGMQAKAKTSSDVKLGEHVITAGLSIQVVFFGVFIIVASVFHSRIAKYPTTRSQELVVPWQKYLVVLYVASVFIMIRSIFRIAEYVTGSDGVLLGHEYYLYIFDATLMFLAMALLNVFHPSNVVSKNHLDEEAAGSGEYVMADKSIRTRST